MIYYKHNETGEVYAYEQADIDKVNQIDEGNAGIIDPVFIKIRDNLANCTKMTAAEVDEHINPTPTPEQLAERARDKRNSKLRELDAVVSNPLRWAEFDDATKQALSTYRQALLDVPQQEGFPDEIDWPINPLEWKEDD